MIANAQIIWQIHIMLDAVTKDVRDKCKDLETFVNSAIEDSDGGLDHQGERKYTRIIFNDGVFDVEPTTIPMPRFEEMRDAVLSSISAYGFYSAVAMQTRYTDLLLKLNAILTEPEDDIATRRGLRYVKNV